MSYPKIDVHAHFLPQFYRDALREAGHLPGPDGMPSIPEWSAEDHLAFMKAQNIKKAYLSISSPGTVLPKVSGGTNGGSQSASFGALSATALTRKCNEAGSSLKREHPDRFGHFASLPLPDVHAAVSEIAHCVQKLAFDGFILHTNAHGIYLGDPRMAPVYEALNARGATVFLHPVAPCATHNAYGAQRSVPQSPGSTPSPKEKREMNAPLSDCYPIPMMEFLFDTTRSVVDLMLTGMVSKYANIRWIIPHCGATLPSLLDRIIRFSSITGGNNPTGSSRAMYPLSTRQVKEMMATNFYFDLAGMPMNSQIHHILRWAPHTRLMYGSDVPFTPWKLAAMMDDEMGESLHEIFGAETGREEIMRISHGNAEQLFST